MATDLCAPQLKFDSDGQLLSVDELYLTEHEKAQISAFVAASEAKTEAEIQQALAERHIDAVGLLTQREWTARHALQAAAEYRREMVEAAGKIDIRLGTETDAKFVCDMAGRVLHTATVEYATVVRLCTQFGLACPPPLRAVARSKNRLVTRESTDDDGAASASRKLAARRQAEEYQLQVETILGPHKERIAELFAGYEYDTDVENLTHLLASLESVRRLRQQPDRTVRTVRDPAADREFNEALADRQREEATGEHAHLDVAELAGLDCWLQKEVLRIGGAYVPDSSTEDSAESTGTNNSDPSAKN